MMFKRLKCIPRGVYYLKFSEILGSMIKLIFNPLSEGEKIKEYVKQLKYHFEADNIVLMPHARISLYFILKTLDFEEGSEIVMTPVTLPDMGNMVHLNKLKPVFTDFTKDKNASLFLDIKSKITSKTRAVYLTHLCGIVYELEEIANYCKDNNLILIQDNTQSYGAKFNNRELHTYADFSFYSTCALKDIHTSVGAFVITRSHRDLEKLNDYYVKFPIPSKKYLLHYLKEDFIASIALNSFIFSIFHYYIFWIIFSINPSMIEDLIDGRGIKFGRIKLFEGLFSGSGLKIRQTEPNEMFYRMTDLQANLGLLTLARMNLTIEKRVKNTKYLYSHFSSVVKNHIIKFDENQQNSFWRFLIIVSDVDKLQKYLFASKIDPGKTTLPTLPNLNLFEFYKQKSPIAEYTGSHAIFIPNFHYLSKRDLDHIVSVLNKYFEENPNA